jgi:transposase
MQRYRAAYPPEFRRQMVELVRSGRAPEELAREFEPTAQSRVGFYGGVNYGFGYGS